MLHFAVIYEIIFHKRSNRACSVNYLTFDDNSFNFPSFGKGGTWWQSRATDGSTGSAARCQNVLSSWVDFGFGKFWNIKVSWMGGIGGVSVMTTRNDGIEEIYKFFVRACPKYKFKTIFDKNYDFRLKNPNQNIVNICKKWRQESLSVWDSAAFLNIYFFYKSYPWKVCTILRHQRPLQPF